MFAADLLDVRNLNKVFRNKLGLFRYDKGPGVKAVSDVSFKVRRGETFGLVGESGCGKTTLSRCIVRGIDATSGEVIYHKEDGTKVDFLKLKGDDYRRLRTKIQMIFQDPYSSLDPRMSVYDIISEPLRAVPGLGRQQISERVKSIAGKVGLDVSYLKRYPHAFSGGQRQRIGIARALVTQPDLIVCDEAVSALDVSIQAQIINLLKDLQKDLKTTYIFVAHNLSVVEHISDRVAVMYLGKIVELAPTENLFSCPKHPYTEALLSAVPRPDPDKKMNRILLKGEVPNPQNAPSGCHFHPRCRFRGEKCDKCVPELRRIGEEHYVACHYADELALEGVTS